MTPRYEILGHCRACGYPLSEAQIKAGIERCDECRWPPAGRGEDS